MLALPVSTASAGFLDSALFLVISWLVMTTGALLVLEVNLYLPKGSNMISMAQTTLGNKGKYLTWGCYLFFLYSLLAAYISGGTDVLQHLASLIQIQLPETIASLLFTLLLGTVVYNGIQMVDWVNRSLMFVKLGTLLLLMLLIAPHVSIKRLGEGEFKVIYGAMMILITSFGFASIVPSLRSYFDDDIPALRKAIIIGSIIPLICYLSWDAILMGVIPSQSFAQIATSGHTTSALTDNLNIAIHSPWITDFFRLFAAICMLTAFLGVSIGLFDFLTDGLKLKKQGMQRKQVFAYTFLPPLLVVIIYPSAYLKALQFAGLLCVILLVLLPTIMAYRARYHLKLTSHYQLAGGKKMLFALGVVSLILIYFAIIEF